MASHLESGRRPLRVALVHYRDAAESGGSLRVGETIANHLDPTRVSAEMVFAYGGPGPVAKSVSVPCHFIGARGPRDFAAWFRARRLFQELQPDVIHFQDGIAWLRAALAGTRYKTLLHVHGCQPVGRGQGFLKATRERNHPFRVSPILYTYLKFTDAQVCINNGTRDSLLNLGWISPKRSYVVYNGIDLSRFSGKRNATEARARLGLPSDALLLGMVCRLVWEKGCADLLSIIERLSNRWHGVICGAGPERQQLEQACKQRGLAHRIHFIGFQNDVTPVYAALDAYAFLSRYEPFGLVLAEAMAAGIPIFGIEGAGEYNEAQYPLLKPGLAELVRFKSEGNREAEIPNQILDEVAERITNYGQSPNSYGPMVERAQAWVSESFSAARQAQVMTRVYEALNGTAVASPQQIADWYQSERMDAAADEFNPRELLEDGKVLA
jgi:glycosyltransferase involved in cell wall biosynthesis